MVRYVKRLETSAYSPKYPAFCEFKRSCKFSDSQKYLGFSKMDKKNVQFSIQETFLGKKIFVRP